MYKENRHVAAKVEGEPGWCFRLDFFELLERTVHLWGMTGSKLVALVGNEYYSASLHRGALGHPKS